MSGEELESAREGSGPFVIDVATSSSVASETFLTEDVSAPPIEVVFRPGVIAVDVTPDGAGVGPSPDHASSPGRSSASVQCSTND